MRGVSHTSAGHPERPTVVYGRGPRETEELLLEELQRLLQVAAPGLPHPPIRIVVPSKSLRLHLLAQIVPRRGRPVAGVECDTLHALAERVARDSGHRTPQTVDLFPILARRLAAQELPLRRSLGHLRDGYGTILGSVRDLLDAGFGPAHLDATEDALREAEAAREASPGSIERALSIARIAAAAAGGLESRNLGRTSTLLATAAELVRHEPSALPPTSTLVVYGFSDATGVATDFLEALLVRSAGTAFLDRPPDPARPDVTDSGVVFGRRLAERLEAAAGEVRGTPDGSRAGTNVRMLAAPGRVAEVRAIADTVLDLLAEGASAETIGIVARNLDAYRYPLRTHFGRAGVPFSGVGARGPLNPAGRRIRALLDLLSRREKVAVERWLDARSGGFAGVERFELRLALHALGAGRLDEAANLALDSRLLERGFPLPVRRGFRKETDDDQDDGTAESRLFLERRRIPGAALGEAIAAARDLSHRLRAGRERRRLAEHLADLRRLIFQNLSWGPQDRATRTLEDTLSRGLDRLPGELEIDSTELALLLEEELRQSGGGALGGAGGGVQILDVTEARQRTFAHLFVLGLNRGEFPREVREDPVLSDPIRRVLGREGHGVLPDLATKHQGHDEEKFLFAQLLSAAPSVTLSWRRSDDKGTILTPSPLVERIRWSEDRPGDERLEPTIVRSLFEIPEPSDSSLELRLHTAAEYATRAGLQRVGGPARDLALTRVFTLAMAEAVADLAPTAARPTPSELALARLEAVKEWDGGFELRGTLGPLFGFIGTSQPHDPRGHEEIWVTTLEGFFRCPWKSFLERLLKLEPLPDPLEALPGLDRLLLGGLVHRVAEAIVRLGSPTDVTGDTQLEEILQAPGFQVPWPDAATLEAMTRSAAEDIAREEGLALPGFARVLARAALPFLEQLRLADWSGEAGGPTVLAAEILGKWEIPRSMRPGSLRFRADRVDRLGDTIRLSDYKCGGHVLSEAARASTRRQHLLDKVAKGLSLQAAAYAMATYGRTEGDESIGRYLFLDPDLDVDDEKREAVANSDDGDLVAAFEESVATGTEAWSSGVFVPKVVETTRDEEPRACQWCEVAQACVRGDSGLRARLRSWIDDHPPAHESQETAATPEETLVRLWWQGTKVGG